MKTSRFFVPPLFGPVVRQRFIIHQMRAMFPLRGAPRPMVLSQALLGRFAQRNRKELDGGGASTPTARTLRRGLQALFAKLGVCARAPATATVDASAAPCVTASDAPDDRCAAAGRSLLAHPGRRRDTVRRLVKAAQRDLLAVHRSRGALCTPLRRGSSSNGPHPSATSTTERRTNNARSASEAVQEAQESVERAEAEVLKLELTRDALECKVLNLPLNTKVEDVLSRWKRIDSTVKEMLRITAQSVYDSVSTVEEAKVEFKDAKRELKEAEVKLEKAKADVKEAKAALEKAKTELPLAELTPRVQAALSSDQLRIASLSVGAIVKAQGMTDLAGEMVQKLPSLGSIDMMQHTIAFVVTCSSGVGKTFFSLAAAKLLSDELKGKVGTLYLGLNSGVPLQDDEVTLLRQAPTYESVERVLLRRLLIQLECLLVWKGSPLPFTFDKYGLQHMVEMDDRWLRDLPLLEGALGAARDKALELLPAVQKAYELSHLMLVIDEGQTLDSLIPPDSMPDKQGGARCALRWTRDLQLAACKRKCGLLCFGLMTGIDPTTSLADKTTGTNHSLRHMPMELDDFKNLTKIALAIAMGKMWEFLDEASCATSDSNKQPPTPSNEQVNRVAAYCYPEARALNSIQVDDEYEFVKSSVEDALLGHGVLPEDVRRKIVVGAVAGLPVDNTDWARTVPSTWAPEGRRTPCPSYAMLTGRLLKRIFSPLGNELKIKDWCEFEAFAGEALRLLIWVLHEVSRTANNCFQEHSHGDVMNGIFPAQKAHPSFRSKVMEAFPATVKGFSSKYPEDAKSKYYPSSALGNHDDAFAVGEKSPALADMFKKCTDELFDSKGGWGPREKNTLLFRCGGSAPMDFVILHKKSESEWQLTLADAKHTSNDSTKSTPKEMAKKGDKVFRYLEHQLKTAKRTKTKEYGVTLTWDRTVLLITNATSEAAVEEVPLLVRDDGTQPEPVAIVRLMPSTFKMGSVTKYLFALPSTANNDGAAVPTPVPTGNRSGLTAETKSESDGNET